MEQTVIDFFAKSSELILYNRITTPKVQEGPPNHTKGPNQSKFQLSFEKKFNLSSKIPPQWTTSHGNKLLVLEFSLCKKGTGEKFLVEQWFFELNQVSDRKIKDTIDSPNTLYKKLSILLRSISLLTVTLPLHKSFVGDKNSPLAEYYTLEHSIHFTSHTLSSWHSTVYEEKSLVTHANPDLVLPGKTFIFKVNYPKSLNFLQIMIDGLNSEPTHLNALREKLDIDYFNPKKRNRATSNPLGTPHSIRKSTSDSNKINTSNGNMSPKETFPIGSEGISENLSPFGSMFTPSPIETQMKSSPRHIAELKARKNSGGSYPWETKNSAGNRPRFGTVDSHSSGEYDMYIYENEEFTEVVSIREIDQREESPRKFSLHPRASEDEQTFTSTSKKIEAQDLKLSTNARPIEMLIEQSDDDKLAEIIRVIDELKDFYHLSFTQEINEQASSKAADSNDEKQLKRSAQIGFKFYAVKEDINTKNVSSDYDDLKDLYAKLKTN